MAGTEEAKRAAVERWERMLKKDARKREIDEADTRKVLARAREITAGSKLKFGKESMEKAFHAFILATRTWRNSGGDRRDYLSAFGVYTRYGSPWCLTCEKHFNSNFAYATHMMSAEHTYRTVAPDALLEVRAHIQAFPIDGEDYRTLDAYKMLKNYQFRNL